MYGERNWPINLYQNDRSPRRPSNVAARIPPQQIYHKFFPWQIYYKFFPQFSGSDQIILAVEKTEARYCKSFLMFFINLSHRDEAISTDMDTDHYRRGLNIIASRNLGIRSRQCILLMPSEWTFLFASPRFDDALKADLSNKWEISESPVNQISVRGYIKWSQSTCTHRQFVIILFFVIYINNRCSFLLNTPPSYWIHFMFCFSEIHIHCATFLKSIFIVLLS